MTQPLTVVFSARSRARLHEIQGYIAFHNIRAARSVVDRIIYAAEMLADHPLLGTVWQGGPTRALTVPGLPTAFITGCGGRWWRSSRSRIRVSCRRERCEGGG
jgi:plasmid stabilization system protein ParE